VSAGEFREFMNRLERARSELRTAADFIAKAQAQLMLLEKLGEKFQAALDREGIS
jgi:hypothetical protein